MDQEPTPKRDNPRQEPEIIPPDRAGARPPQGRSHVWISVNGRPIGGKAPGPVGILLAAVAVIFVLALVLMLVLGALLIWIPVVAVIVAAALVVGFVKGYFRRPR